MIQNLLLQAIPADGYFTESQRWYLLKILYAKALLASASLVI